MRAQDCDLRFKIASELIQQLIGESFLDKNKIGRRTQRCETHDFRMLIEQLLNFSYYFTILSNVSIYT